MTSKLYVARLPFVFSDAQLRELFEAVGPVASAVMVPDPKNNRSRGFGFVTMQSDELAKLAMETLNGKEVEGKQIFITEARPKKKPETDGPEGESAAPPRRPFGRPPERGSSYTDSRPPRRYGYGGDRPRAPRPEGSGFAPRGPRREGGFGDRPRAPRPEGSGFAPRGPRREGGFGDRPRGPRPEGSGFGSGPRRPSFGDKPRFSGPRGPRPEGSGFGSGPQRPSFGDKPRFSGPRPPRPEGSGFGSGPKRPGGFKKGPPRGKPFNKTWDKRPSGPRP